MKFRIVDIAAALAAACALAVPVLIGGSPEAVLPALAPPNGTAVDTVRARSAAVSEQRRTPKRAQRRAAARRVPLEESTRPQPSPPAAPSSRPTKPAPAAPERVEPPASSSQPDAPVPPPVTPPPPAPAPPPATPPPANPPPASPPPSPPLPPTAPVAAATLPASAPPPAPKPPRRTQGRNDDEDEEDEEDEEYEDEDVDVDDEDHEDDEDDGDEHHASTHEDDEDHEDDDEDEEDEDGRVEKKSWAGNGSDGDEAEVAVTNPLADVLLQLAVEFERSGHRPELVVRLRELAERPTGRPVVLEIDDD